MMSGKEKIIEKIQKMAGRYSVYEIFSDWVAICALSIRIQTCVTKEQALKNEQKYIDIAKKYTPDEVVEMAWMMADLAMAYDDGIRDILGEIYMELGLGSKNTGQFFTPFHVSMMVAEMAIPEHVDIEHPYIINEPSCGGGGMIIAAAKVLWSRGLNFQKCMYVTAQDLDWKGVYMTYLQLSMLGIQGKVVQGDALTEPYEQGYPEERVLIMPGEAIVRLWEEG